MIRLRVIKKRDERDQFCVYGNEPFRVEVMALEGGGVIAHVYTGLADDREQSPVFCYDGTLEKNSSVVAFSESEVEQIRLGGRAALLTYGLNNEEMGAVLEQSDKELRVDLDSERILFKLP